MNIFFDIETIPSQLPGIREELAAGIEPPGNISKAETVAAWHAEKKPLLVEEAYLKTSFDGGYGQSCVIGWAIEDETPQAYFVQDLTHASERKMLEDFFCVLTDAYSVMDRPVFIGHNVIGFDLRFLWQRAMVLGVRPPAYFPRDPKPWSESVFDTMLAWDSQQRAGGSMARLCRLFGLEGKGDMDGSKVWPAVQEGRIQEVADYCCDDVERTRNLHKRMTFA